MAVNDDRTAALRALRDCGVVRVELGKVARGFQLLQREGLLSAKGWGGTHAHLRLNDDGKVAAAIALA